MVQSLAENYMTCNDEDIASNKVKPDIPIAESNIFKTISTLKIVFLLENLIGIYRFSLKDGKLLPPNLFQKLYGFCLVGVSLTFYFMLLKLPAVIDGTSSLVDTIDEIPCIVLLGQYVLTLISTNIFHSKSNRDIFAEFSHLDDLLIMAIKDDFYREAKYKANKYVVLLILAHIALSVTDLLTEDEISGSVIMFLPLYLIQKFETIVFCLEVDMLKSRLDVINGYIAKFLEAKDGDKASVFTIYEGVEAEKTSLNIIGHPSPNNVKIRELSGMFDSIGSICSLINSVFNFQIFMTLVSTFTYIVITIWAALYFYRTPENNPGPLASTVIWCWATLMTVVAMCSVCERLRMARNTTKVLVNEIIMDYNLPKTMRVQAKAFMELIEAWPLRILIYDMFSVDITLMLKFISVSTTYLIIIIQVSHFA